MAEERILGGRFEPLRPLRGMGAARMYEARDRATGERVLLKLVPGGESGAERLAREVQALAGLKHASVPRYVAHGGSGSDLFLATEWIEGETLSARLGRGSLAVPEGLALAARLASALGVVHRAGMVHRDLRPAGILLAGGTPGTLDRPVLIDFGAARLPGAAARPARAGAVIGTPGYVAPEQARGEPDLDARADVFSLGCVLFRCLTGADPFTGGTALALTLKVLLEEPPRVRDLRPGIPPEVDALVARLMAKQKQLRPLDGDAVAVELEALGAPASAAQKALRSASGAMAAVITANERRLMSLVLVGDVRAPAPDSPPGDGPVSSGRHPKAESERRMRALRATAERHQGRLEVLPDGAMLVVLTSAESPTDLAARAARCALAVRASLSGAPAALVTGRAEIEARLPVGELIDRAVCLLAPAADQDASTPVRLDELTARLLGPGFHVRAGAPDPGGGPCEFHELHGERNESEPARSLLGLPTSCVGRERELALLEAAFAQCADSPAAVAVLVSAPAGTGKSRLRRELICRLRERGEPFELWIGRGDRMSASAAFGLLARAVRHALGIAGSEPVQDLRRRILARVASLPDAQRVAAFLGELVGAPFPEEVNAQLRAARRDPVLMGDQIRRAAEDLLRAACSDKPVVLVLEDLQWGDLPTVTFLDAALRNLADQPLLVMALGRPEVQERFPKLWAGRPVQSLPLGALPRRGAERLVRQTLGEAATPAVVQAVCERAGGNALYLEELIRAVADGQGDRLPETVVAMAQARLEGLDPEARRILRAASVFGGTFWLGGVEALLGGASIGQRVEDLIARELVVRRGGDGKPAAAAYAFRHELEREAAYGMLTEADRALGHRLAGAWLERERKGDPIALAQHFERGGEPVRAASWYRRAAADALRGNDLSAALAHAERGIACNAGWEDLGALHLVKAEVHLWRGELARAEADADEAISRLDPGSSDWFRAITHAAVAASKQGAPERTEAAIKLVDLAAPAKDELSALVFCLASCAAELTFGGRYGVADGLIERGGRHVGDPPTVDGQALGMLHQACAFRAMVDGDPGAAMVGFEAALLAFAQAGDQRSVCSTQMNLGYTLAELGDFGGAEGALCAALAEAERMGLHELIPGVQQNLGYALIHAGRLDEARRALEQTVETFRAQGNARMEGLSHAYLARVALLSGDGALAEREARAAAALLQVAPPLRAVALAALARALLAQGRAAEALTPAGEAFAQLEAAGSVEEGESLVWLAYAETLAAAGRRDEEKRARASARERLMARAERIRDPDFRTRFLAQVPDNAALLTTHG